MWNFVESLSENALPSWFRWLTILAIGLPIVGAIMGGVCGWCAFVVSDRLGAVQSKTILGQNEQINHLTGDLTLLNKQASELIVRAQNAERGISDTYDFNGGHRQNLGGGRTSLSLGSEVSAFQTFNKLMNDKDWLNLKDKSESQIKETPSWLTPYLFSGIALANLGVFSEARQRLQFVVDRAGNDPNYSDATRILSEIRAKADR